MTDEFHGVSRDEYQADRLLSEQDWADWRAARGWEAQHRPTHAEMVAHFAADRAEVEGVAERAIVHDGWRTYPNEVRAEPEPNTRRNDVPTIEGDPGVHALQLHGGRQASAGDVDSVARPHLAAPNLVTVHATFQLTVDGDPTIDELRAQLAAIGFDTIDIEEAT